jgi:hypothetical protein
MVRLKEVGLRKKEKKKTRTCSQIWWENLLENVQSEDRGRCGKWKKLAEDRVLWRAFVFWTEK